MGRYVENVVAGETVRAFVPDPLPPREAIVFDGARQRLLDRATQALGQLESITQLLPEPGIFLYAYVRKEAVPSSQIEGTQSSLSDLLLYEADAMPCVPFDDVAEVSQYVAALEHGMARLEEGFPLCNRLLREMHEVLLSHGRGSCKQPGAFRRSQNWIGGTRPGNAYFVPPPPQEVEACMGDLERFMHDESVPYPALIKAAMVHVQLEKIHPFLDGNGRLGRLLVSFVLCHDGLLGKPLLYLSLYLKQHRSYYYDLLNRVWEEGEWEAWIDFFLEGVEQTALDAVERARRMRIIIEEDASRVGQAGRAAGSMLRLLHAMARRPLGSIKMLQEATGLSYPAVSSAVGKLQAMGILDETTHKERNRIFGYTRLLDVLNG
jgi:Fic family protein